MVDVDKSVSARIVAARWAGNQHPRLWVSPTYPYKVGDVLNCYVGVLTNPHVAAMLLERFETVAVAGQTVAVAGEAVNVQLRIVGVNWAPDSTRGPIKQAGRQRVLLCEPGRWAVESASFSSTSSMWREVRHEDGEWWCSCPSGMIRHGAVCRHVRAVADAGG